MHVHVTFIGGFKVKPFTTLIALIPHFIVRCVHPLHVAVQIMLSIESFATEITLEHKFQMLALSVFFKISFPPTFMPTIITEKSISIMDMELMKR